MLRLEGANLFTWFVYKTVNLAIEKEKYNNKLQSGMGKHFIRALI